MEEPAVKKLVAQLESRMRQLELENHTTLLIPRNHVIAQHLRATASAYAEAAKQKKFEMEPPEPQLFVALLYACKSWCEQADSNSVTRQAAMMDRLIHMTERQELQEVTQWVKTMTIAPTYDKPGKDKFDRITMCIRGQVALMAADKERELMQQIREQPNNPEWQQTPTELTQSMLQRLGKHEKIVALESVLTTVLRAAGAKVLAGRAPRGNLARALIKTNATE